MNYDALEFWLKVSAAVAQVVSLLWLFWINKSKATNARIGELEDSTTRELREMAIRLERLEADTRHAPTHEDLKHIHRRLDESTGEMRELGGKMDAAIRTLALIQEHLLSRSR